MDLHNLPGDFNAVYERGYDQIISPVESRQSDWRQKGGDDEQEWRGFALEQAVYEVNRPTREDHNKEILRQIICGNNLIKGGGKFLHGLAEQRLDLWGQFLNGNEQIFPALARL